MSVGDIHSLITEAKYPHQLRFLIYYTAFHQRVQHFVTAKNKFSQVKMLFLSKNCLFILFFLN